MLVLSRTSGQQLLLFPSQKRFQRYVLEVVGYGLSQITVKVTAPLSVFVGMESVWKAALLGQVTLNAATSKIRTVTFKFGERIVIGPDIKIGLESTIASGARLSIEAPKSVIVHRYELYVELLNARRQLPTHERAKLRGVPLVAPKHRPRK